ncbi:MAG: hypothetical protein APU95_03740 [Hadesarchaea archaeon YNP_N21]|nr:MAG: hypothetical protein APU95_03740 [Hadesarchaea archaeon YNP_N21]
MKRRNLALFSKLRGSADGDRSAFASAAYPCLSSSEHGAPENSAATLSDRARLPHLSETQLKNKNEELSFKKRLGNFF